MSYYSIAIETHQRAIEKNLDTIKTQTDNLSFVELEFQYEVEQQIRSRLLISRHLPKAQAMFWATDTARLVHQAAANLPIHDTVCNMNLLTVTSAFCYFDQPFVTVRRDANPEIRMSVLESPLCALAWFWIIEEDFPAVLCIVPFIKTRTGLELMEIAYCKSGDVFPENHNGLFSFVLAANAFLRQRLLINRPHPVERHARKRLEKTGAKVPSTVSVVHLRAAEHSSVRGNSSDTPVEYSCRWFVRGHWRNQYYKHLGGTRPRYIFPYLKGPDDKPIKVPAASVYAVVR